ncbi:MAG: HAD family hydrolase [Armatimonadetes bacterium]|nr:HAD family hydrolase [Armatimonadota bacterium]
MQGAAPGRSDAWELLCTYTAGDGLRKHALAVEAAMRTYAERAGEDADVWGICGLIHDFDYERWPDASGHPVEGSRILAELGWPEPIITSVLGHADYSGVPRETPMARSLYAVDELCGLIMAVAYVKPGRSLSEVDVRSVRKKMKDKAFARAVSREDIVLGADELGMDLDEHIGLCLAALQRSAEALGL